MARSPAGIRTEAILAMATLLCVSRNTDLADLVRYSFTRKGFAALVAATHRESVSLVRDARVDLILLDNDAPEEGDMVLLGSLRAASPVPIIVLTSRTQEAHVLACFAEGADACLTKPFSMPILIATVTAMLRRTRSLLSPPSSPTEQRHQMYPVAGARFDVVASELATEGGARIPLTPAEGRILEVLLIYQGQTLSAGRILEYLWGHKRASDVNVIKTHMRHLRAKIAALPNHPTPIYTRPGKGYVLIDPAGAPTDSVAFGATLDGLIRVGDTPDNGQQASASCALIPDEDVRRQL